MRASILSLAMFATTAGLFAQCHGIGEVNAVTPEGQLLQQIGQEQDATKKAALSEEFVEKYPKNEAVGWVYEQLIEAYGKANQPDKVIAAEEKLAAIPPDCPETAHLALKAAEAKKDPDLVMKWAAITSEQALKVASSPQPADADAVEHWKQRVDYAKQVNTYTEYADYAAALQTTDPQKKIALVESLQKRNPKSEYLAKSYPILFAAYRQAGMNDKALALAENVVATDPSDEDMLLVVADSYLQKKKEPDKVHQYTEKIVELMNSKPKPDGVADADWDKRKALFIGVAHFLNGKLYYEEGKFEHADKELRAGLPHMTDPNMKPEALYYLGFANYKLEKIQESANFYKECAAIHSRFQPLASKNLAALRTQYRGIR